MRKLIPTMILLGLITLACSGTGGHDSASIEVIALDGTGNMVPGVTVELFANDRLVAAVPTGLDGVARFDELPAGRYRLEATQADARSGPALITIAGEDRRVVFQLPAPEPIEEAIVVTARADSEAKELEQGHGKVVGGMIGGVLGSPASVAPPPHSAPVAYSMQPGVMERVSGEEYASIEANAILETAEKPVSTFSIDVDTASYSNIRRFIRNGVWPPRDAIRIEEMVNYFTYDDPAPSGGEPFEVTTEVASTPWSGGSRLLRIAIRGRDLPEWERKPNNLVFLIDSSGSMSSPDKLPLLKRSFRLLAGQLRHTDTVAIVTYAGHAGTILEPTPGDRTAEIHRAIESIGSQGSTAGAAGIRAAYELARRNHDPRANNRVILATDGDFNVGISSADELQTLIEKERESGVYLSVLGFGTGNLKDARMETLADKGNGNYAYIDSLLEARKVLIEEMGGTLHTIASDVKIQVELDPAAVQRYRLIGYENRRLANEDFDDDTKDAGELGSAHNVIAFYEIFPAPGFRSGSIGEVRLRFKRPESDTSELIRVAVADQATRFDEASSELRFSAAVAWLGELLREGREKVDAERLQDVLAIVRNSQGLDFRGYRADLLQLVDSTIALAGGSTGPQPVVSDSRESE